MATSRLKSFVGFAVKAGKAIYGVDNITTGRKRPYLILYSAALSERSAKNLTEYADKYGIETATTDMEEILPNRNCKALGISDKNLAEAVKSELKETGL